MASPKKTLLLLFIFGSTAVAGVIGVFTAFVKLAEVSFVPGEEVYLRDIYVIIDQTLSMKQGQRKEAKDMLSEEIIYSLGLGDRISCYRIGSNFQETSDRVFKSTRHLPKVYDNVPGMAVADLPPKIRTLLVQRWEVFSREKTRWLENLRNLEIPRGNYSDYLGTLAEIGRRINDPGDPNLAREKWLVVIGDLKHEPLLEQLPPPAPEERRQFAEVHIHMVYPGGIHSDREQLRIEMFWKQYFNARGAREVHFISFDGFVGRFPGNTVPQPAGLQRVGN